MKITKRIALLMAAMLMIASAAVPAFADTIIDYVLYTDIKTYINDIEITSYNIKGNTAVVVEDLASYGFDVAWDGSARTLKVVRNSGKAITGSAVTATSGGKVGDKAMPVYATDIKTYLDGKETESYNVGGRTIVYVDDLAALYASDYKWDPAAKTLKATLSGSAAKPAAAAPETPKFEFSEDKAVLCYHMIDRSSVKSNIGHFDNEGEENIFDQDTGTKWCTNVNEFNNGKKEVIVEWAMTEPVMLVSYKITTANDDVEWPGRIPKSWTLQAREKKSSKWAVIDTETSASIPKKNLTDSGMFVIDEPGKYQYYRLVITENQGGAEVFQFSELKLYAYDIAPAKQLYNYDIHNKVLEFMKTNGVELDDRYGIGIDFDDGDSMVIWYYKDMNLFYAVYEMDFDTFTISVSVPLVAGLNTGDSAIAPIMLYMDFKDSDDSDVEIKGYLDGGIYQGYPNNEGLSVVNADGELEEGGETWSKMVTNWALNTNFILDKMVSGASIADFGFTAFNLG